jgi:hypothetical protein
MAIKSLSIKNAATLQKANKQPAPARPVAPAASRPAQTLGHPVASSFHPAPPAPTSASKPANPLAAKFNSFNRAPTAAAPKESKLKQYAREAEVRRAEQQPAIDPQAPRITID